MDQTEWQKVTDIFGRALECAPGERDSFLADACAGNQTLRDQVAQLLDEYDNLGDFLEDPLAIPERGLESGDTIADRYRIDALIGRGGMGEVYRAHDTIINESIALKALRPELGRNSAFVRRFRREVQLARKVTHPHVCRVFDVGVHTWPSGRETHFFTMQLLEGETLAARIHSGVLPKDDALVLVTQMADGLDAAHRAGIVHRDFKSANVMLSGQQAVIMDFGLAHVALGKRAADTAESITQAGSVAGTIGYMSPEQLSGDAVGAASDIYSFGIVVFEIATGRLPFNEHHIIQSAMQRAARPVPDIRALAPELDAQWAAAIARCLQRDPAKRFSSAGDVAAHLRAGWRPPPVYWTRRQWLIAATAIGAMGTAAALSRLAFRFIQQTPVLDAGATALITPIANATGEPQFDGINELFRNQLAQSVHFSVIEDSSLSKELARLKTPDSIDPADLRLAGYRLNSGLSVFGNVSRIGPDYALNIQIETRGSSPNTPKAKMLRSFSAADAEGLRRTVREACLWIRETVGESLASIASFDRLPEDATTASWKALTYFARGQGFYMKNDWEAATLEFEAALREDPKFTLAAMRRADVLMSQNRQTAGMAQWRAAIAMLNERTVTRGEELFGRGMFAFDSGDLESSDRYFRTWSVEYPYDWRPRYYRTIQLCMDGHASQAVELLNALRTTMPDYGELDVMLIACHLVLGQTAEARRLIPIARPLLTRPERADLREAFIRFCEADCVGCLEVLRAVQKSTYRRAAADAMLDEGLLLIDAGYPEASAANIERFLRSGSWVETAPEQISLRVVQAWAEMLAGHREAAIEHASAVLQSESGALIIALTGTIFARLGAKDRAGSALRMTSAFQDLHLHRMARHRIVAELANANGHVDVAVAEFRQAAALEPAIAHRQYLIEALPPGSAEQLELARHAVRVPWQSLRPPLIHGIGAMRAAVPIVVASGVNDPFTVRFVESSRKLSSLL